MGNCGSKKCNVSELSLRDQVKATRDMIVTHGSEISTSAYYSSPRISSEIPDCSMPLSFDLYSSCSFSCSFCFAFYQKSSNPAIKNRDLKCVNVPRMIKELDGTIDSLMYKHFYKRKFLLHWGGLADPFCNFELQHFAGLPLIEKLGELNYPTLFSTKGAALVHPNYLKVWDKYADQNNFAFQVSMVTADDDLSRQVEVDVPPPSFRFKVMKELSDRGYWCLDKDTEVFHKTKNSPYIRKTSLERLYRKHESVLVNCDGTWKEAKPMRVAYDGYWYKVTLRNGAEILQIDRHLNLTSEGLKRGENIQIGDEILVSTKPMNWDCDRGSYELGRFIGFWIAEGCYVNDSGCKFTFNTNETEYIKFVKDFCTNLGAGVFTGTTDNWTDVIVYSPYLRSMLDYFVHRENTCDTISINNICYSMSIAFRKGLFNGWAEGDGNDKLQIHSISKKLINDMFIIANTLGIKCSIGNEFLQVCDIHSKNAKVYRFRSNAGINYRMYSAVVKVEKFKDGRKQNAYCLEVPDGHRFELANGIITHNCILRLRPFIVGITDLSLDEMLDKALKAGIKAISTEFFAIDSRCNVGMKTRYDSLAKLIGTDDLQKYFSALSPSERGGYMRLNRHIKEPFVKKIYKFCIDNGLTFGCSDPDFKELCTSGSCCAMPDDFPKNRLLENWTRNQMTYHLKELRKLYHTTGECGVLTFDQVYGNESYFEDHRLAQDHPTVIGRCTAERMLLTPRIIVMEQWNNNASPANPRNYFHGKLEPCGFDEQGNLKFRYVPMEYEAQWAAEGIDLTK